MIEIQDIDRVLKDRSIWGRPYKDINMESKRRSAIIYLRRKSKRGWVLDRVVGKMTRTKP